MGANAASQTGNGEINLSGTGVLETARSITKGAQGTATVNFDGGTYRLRAAQATMFGTGVVTNIKAGGAVIDTNAFDGTVGTILAAGSPSGGLTKQGAGVLTLNGNNSYTGGTTVTAGVLALGNSGALGTTGTITMNGGTLRFSAANTGDYSSRILLADGKTAVFDTNSQNVTFATALQVGTLKTAILNKTGTGTLTLGAANTHTGGTSIAGSSGVVSAIRISNGSALGTGTLTIGSGGNLDQSRLELTGGIAVSNAVAAMTSRNNFIPSILNVSGNNSMSGNLSSGGGGARITFQSDSDRLTLSGSVGVRNPLFTGSGDFLVSGNITSP
jgi:autotransporter-associated beta strand protein